jgi:prepilin-type N-terminal cleavage/methylation domain-containing protein
MSLMRDGRARQRGFTLAEVAIAFVIIALLIGGTVLTLSAQTEAREITDTQRTLDQAREAIIGFALRNGRLPCPAPGAGNAIESFCTNGGAGACGAVILAPPGPVPVHGRCSSPNGFVPAATLGIGPIETNPASPNFGLLLDSWLQPIRYSVTQVFSPTPPPNTVMLFTAPGEMRSNILASPPIAPDLVVCTTSAGAVPATPACGATVPSFQTPALVYSTGKNAVAAGVGVDEVENGNGDRIFVARPPTPFNPPAAGFDDLVIWISPNILYNRLIAGGAI